MSAAPYPSAQRHSQTILKVTSQPHSHFKPLPHPITASTPLKRHLIRPLTLNTQTQLIGPRIMPHHINHQLHSIGAPPAHSPPLKPPLARAPGSTTSSPSSPNILAKPPPGSSLASGVSTSLSFSLFSSVNTCVQANT